MSPHTFRIYWTDEYGRVLSAQDAKRHDLDGAITFAANRLKSGRGLAGDARDLAVRALTISLPELYVIGATLCGCIAFFWRVMRADLAKAAQEEI